MGCGRLREDWQIFIEMMAGFHNYIPPVVSLGCVLCDVTANKGKSLNTGGSNL